MSYEPLDLEGFSAPPPRDLGAVSQLQWLALADLVVDHTYQRDLTPDSRKRIARIAAEFDWSCFTPVIAAPVEGGLFAVIDGQHRATAAALVGVKKIPAMCVVADRQRQAKAFAAINGNLTRMNARAVYRAGLAAGEPKLVAIDALATSCGVRMLTHPRTVDRMHDGDCGAPAEVVRIYDGFGEAPLRSAFAAVLASKGDTRGLLTTVYLRSLAMLFRAKPLGLETIRKAFPHIDLRDALQTVRREGEAGDYSDLRDEIARRLAKLAAGVRA